MLFPDQHWSNLMLIVRKSHPARISEQLWAGAGSHVGSQQLDSAVGYVRFASPRTLTSSSTKHAGFSVPSDEDESLPNVTFP